MRNLSVLDAALRTLPVLALSVIPCAASAATPESSAPIPGQSCAWADFAGAPGPHLSSAAIKAAPGARVYFYKASERCPQGPEKLCRDQAYLVAGDRVAVAKHQTGFACAWFQRRKVNDAIVGWLPIGGLDESEAPASPPLAAWVHAWSRFVAPGNEANLTVSLEPDGQSLHVVGAAEWMSRAMESSGPHTGEVDGSGRPQGNRLVVGDAGACVLELYLLGEDTLFAVDHHSCGGMNVTFDGLY